MNWLLQHWSELTAIVTGGAAVVSDARRRKAKRDADRLATELDLIRTEAKTKARWEVPTLPPRR